jgi:hypothetical protein
MCWLVVLIKCSSEGPKSKQDLCFLQLDTKYRYKDEDGDEDVVEDDCIWSILNGNRSLILVLKFSTLPI